MVQMPDTREYNREYKGKKRALAAGEDVRQFLNLEAEVDNERSDDDDDDEEFDDFLEDDEPVAGDRSLSHHLLSLEHTRAQAEGEWDRLLARARQPAQQHDRNTLPHVTSRLQLWKVAVKPGWEETVTFLLMEKLLRDGIGWNIASIIGRVSRPGWIVIEAASLVDVHAVCQGISNIWGEMRAVEPAGGPACLDERTFTPRPHSWVRLAKHPYKGDLAYVRPVGAEVGWRNAGVSLLVVPRIDFQRRKRGQPSKCQRTWRDRPDQALFDVNKTKEIFGSKSVVTKNQVSIFRRKLYLDGYLCLETDDFYSEEAVPTLDEIAFFQHLNGLPKDFFQRTLELLAAQRLCVGDSAKVVEGEAQGIHGIIHNILDQEVVLRTSSGSELSLAITVLRKRVKVGDEVVIVVGPSTGVTGWVVSISGEKLVLFNHKTAEEVETSSHCVNFWQAPFQFGRSLQRVESQAEIDHRERILTVAELESRGPLPSTELQDQIDKLRHDPNRHLIGRHVQIIEKHRYKGWTGIIKSAQGSDHVMVEVDDTLPLVRLHLKELASCDDPERKTLGHDPNRHLIGRHVRVINHRLRDYKGIIKSTQQDDHVQVEIQATMRQESLPLAKLVFLDDCDLKPLGKRLRATASTSRRTTEIPESTLPLIPSTPLPPNSSVWLSPAWDPSSRTPNPNCSFTQNPWMESAWFVGKQVKLQVKDTTPVLSDPGWKHGYLEDRFGLWAGTEGSNVKVVLGRHETILLPEKYVRTVRPSVKGQSVIVLNGVCAGQEYHVVTLGNTECEVGRRRNGRLNPRSKMTFFTSNLAVVA